MHRNPLRVLIGFRYGLPVSWFLSVGKSEALKYPWCQGGDIQPHDKDLNKIERDLSVF